MVLVGTEIRLGLSGSRGFFLGNHFGGPPGPRECAAALACLLDLPRICRHASEEMEIRHDTQGRLEPPRLSQGGRRSDRRDVRSNHPAPPRLRRGLLPGDRGTPGQSSGGHGELRILGGDLQVHL